MQDMTPEQVVEYHERLVNRAVYAHKECSGAQVTVSDSRPFGPTFKVEIQERSPSYGGTAAYETPVSRSDP